MIYSNQTQRDEIFNEMERYAIYNENLQKVLAEGVHEYWTKDGLEIRIMDAELKSAILEEMGRVKNAVAVLNSTL